ncbi:urea transporter [compost metagenome]
MATGYPVLVSESIDQAFMLFPNAIGQVIFQTGIWPGLLFIIGIAINRPLAALFVLVAVALSAIIAYLVQIPSSDIYLGLLGYNAVLCVIVFTGKTIKDIVLAFLSMLLSVGIMILMMKTGLVALTFPFVLATWITLGVDKLSFSRSASEK